MSIIGFWQLVGFLSVSALGSFLHFLFPLTNNKIVALFSSVNESTWEHMKLLFFPMLLFSLIEFLFIGKDIHNFWCIKLKGILIGLLLIPILFYTLRGAFGRLPEFIPIILFFTSVGAAFLYEAPRFNNPSFFCFERPSIIILCAIALVFMVFTFSPPQIPLFKCPVNNSFGI